MRIALVTSFPAFPASAGNRSRIQQLASAVMQCGHELKFVLLPSDHESVDDAAHEAAFGQDGYVKITAGRPGGPNFPGKWTLRQIGKGLSLVGGWMRRDRTGSRTARRIVSGSYKVMRLLGLEWVYYSALDKFYDSHWARQLSIIGKDVDAVIVEYVFNSWAFECFPASALRLLDTHDAFANRHRSYLTEGVSNYWVSFRPRDESTGFRRADVVLAIQQEEAQRFRRQLAQDGAANNPDVVVVSHFMGESDAPVDCAVDGAAIFLASDNPANRHALDNFLQNVLPRVVREIPDFELRLAGSIAGHVADRPNVSKLGWIQDVRRAFAQAPVSINPLLVGTGINIKLLDAMAAGVPTVSTETGIRGLPASYRAGVLAVPDDDHAEFAAAVVRFAKDAGLRREVGRKAFDNAIRWNAEQKAQLERCLARGAPANAVGAT